MSFLSKPAVNQAMYVAHTAPCGLYVAHLFRDPAVFPCGAALLVKESIEVYCLNAAAAPVFIATKKQT